MKNNFIFLHLRSIKIVETMKLPCFIIFLCVCFSCISHQKEEPVITIDLSSSQAVLPYSKLAKSVDYVTLSTGDSCLMAGVEKMYQDGDTLILKDKRRGGVFVFTRKGEFVKQINYVGSGPEEFVGVNSLAVDKEKNLICIYDISGQKINKYTYQGQFVESVPMKHFIRDFAVLGENAQCMILPFYAQKSECGVWLADGRNEVIKHLLPDVPKEHKFEYMSTYYNQTAPDEIYYYDRNNDYLYLITKDSAQVVYKVNLKQRLPNDVRMSDAPEPSVLNGYAMMNDFCISSKYLIFIYHIFGDRENPYRWVFVDRKDIHNSVVANDLKGNTDEVEYAPGKLFYLDDSTWCRMVQTEEDNCNITLQFIHL